MSRRLTVDDVPIGTRYHCLVTTSAPYVPDGSTESFVRLRCDCGAERAVRVAALRCGHTKSCGCHKRAVTSARNYRHGLRHQPLYEVWASIVQRTTNPSASDWPRYGGRGISLHLGWLADPAAFITWVDVNLGPRPGPRHSLDRIDNNGHYEPGNLRWADDIQQSNNRRPRRRPT